MPYTINWETHGVHTAFSGIINSDEIMQAGLEVYNHPEVSGFLYSISDFTDVTGSSLSILGTVKASRYDMKLVKFSPLIKLALISDKRKITDFITIYGKEMEASDWDVKLFESLDQARDWIDQ